MQNEVEELAKRIELLRECMMNLAQGRALSDPAVVVASQNLDEAINEYTKLKAYMESLEAVHIA